MCIVNFIRWKKIRTTRKKRSTLYIIGKKKEKCDDSRMICVYTDIARVREKQTRRKNNKGKLDSWPWSERHESYFEMQRARTNLKRARECLGTPPYQRFSSKKGRDFPPSFAPPKWEVSCV